MDRGDYVFIPQTSLDVNDEDSFTVATVTRQGYFFEDRSNEEQNTWAKDYGHVRPIAKPRSYPYSPDTLEVQDFRSYRKAVNRVRSLGPRTRLLDFIKQHYRRS
jgi:hypothetical protein